MKIAVLGTGQVGRRLAGKLVATGHEVVLGSRSADNAEAVKWAAEHGAGNGTFADAAAFGDLVVNATGGLVAVAALTAAGRENLAGKVVVDVSNPLDFSEGFPPRVVTFDGRSVAEEIQREFPEARVVKTLNTMNNSVMVDPGLVPGDHNVFLSGDDESAKAATAELLRGFGWRDVQILDLGALSTARATEQFVVLWIHLAGTAGGRDVNIAVHSSAGSPSAAPMIA